MTAPSKLVKANAKHLADQLICHGYINSEQHRMRKIETTCPHFKFKSPKQFCQMYLDIILSKKKDVKTKRHQTNQNTLDNMISIMQNGACHQCCFIMGTYLSELSTLIPSSEIQSENPMEWNDLTKQHRKGYDRDLVVVVSIWWLAIIQKPHIFKYIIRNTVYLEDIWWMLWEPMDHTLALTQLIKQNKYSDSNINTYLSQIALLGFQIVRNAHLLKTHTWQRLLFVYPWPACWFEHVFRQLEIGIFHKYDFGQGVLGLFFILLLMVFANSQNILNSKRALKVERVKEIKKELKKRFNKLKDMKNKSMNNNKYDTNEILQVYNVMYDMFLGLNNDGFCSEMVIFVKDKMEKVFKMRWNNIKCQNIKCKKQIGKQNKFYVCSKCLVARYCRKKCQKYDWNKYNHRKWCNRYVEIRATVDHDFHSKIEMKSLRKGYDIA
eukprot:501273_1